MDNGKRVSHGFVGSLLAMLPAVVGCVGPLSSDDLPARDILFDFDPEASQIPTARGLEGSGSTPDGVNADLAREIDEYDAIGGEGVVFRRSAFAEGQRIWYWSFGPTLEILAPMWVLVHEFEEGETPTFVDHPPVWDVVPGDRAYSPLWRIYWVVVTDEYQGERLLSRRGVDEAVALGLVKEPQSSHVYVNCPVVDEDARMQIEPGSFPGWDEEPCPGDQGTCIRPHWAYYRGVSVAYFDTNGARTFDPRTGFPTADRYELRRETEALPLSEPVRGADITGDEDGVDTNDVFATTPCDDGYTPLHRTTQVFVGADYESIDTHQDETQADARQVSDLFADDGAPRAGVVRGLVRGEVVENLPIERLAECPDP